MIALIGAGALGSALLKGLRTEGHIPFDALSILDPRPSEEAQIWAERGAKLNPDYGQLQVCDTLIIAVKPQGFAFLADQIKAHIKPGSLIISVMAGIGIKSMESALGSQIYARVMPTTAMATGQSIASLYAHIPEALSRTEALFSKVATCVRLDKESQMDAATAVSGSGAAFIYTMVLALQKAGEAAGLSASQAETLARQTFASSARLVEADSSGLETLIKRIASPGGTTEAGLKVLADDATGMDQLILDTVMVACQRSHDLGSN